MNAFQVHIVLHTPMMYPNNTHMYTHILCVLFGYIMTGVCYTVCVLEKIHFQLDA